MIGSIILLIILIAINGVFSGTELAFLSLDKFKLKEEVLKGNKRAKKIEEMLDEPSKFLSTIQIGITFAGFLASAFAADYFADYIVNAIGKTVIPIGVLNSVLVVLITLILSYFTLVFGELVPKRIAMNYPDKIAYDMVNIISVMMKVCYPFIKVLTLSTNFVCKLLHVNKKEEKMTEDDIKKMIIKGTYEGVVEEQEKDYMFNIFEFNDKTLGEIMTPSHECVMLNVNDNLKNIFNSIHQSKYSRYPVYDKKKKEILGIISVKDMVLNYRSRNELKLEDIIYETLYFDVKDKIDDVFREMQNKKVHMAIVLDDEMFAGIVTLEDAIEEIVGNIYDEHN